MFLLGRLKATSPQLITSMLVFSLATGVLGGLIFYFDSTRPIIMSEMMNDVDYHMRLSFTPKFYDDSGISYDHLLSEIKSVDGVADAEHIVRLDTFYNRFWRDVSDRYSFFGMNSSFLNSFSNTFRIETASLPLVGNNCYIELSTYTERGLSINDTISTTLLVKSSGFYYQISTNLTVAGTFETSYTWPDVDNNPDRLPLVRVLVSLDYLIDTFQFLTFRSDSSLKEEIWVNLSDQALTQESPEDAQTELGYIRTRIEQRTVPYAIITDYPVYNAILGYASWSSSLSTIAIAFSIPSLIMGIMLVKYNDDLLEDERRQEIGNIRVRGATGWQSFSWIFSRGLVTATLGSIAAFVTGIIAAALSGSVKELLVFDFQQWDEFSVLITPEATIFVFCFSFVIGTAVSLPAAVKSLLVSPVEAHHRMRDDSLIQIETMRNPTLDLLIIVISGLLSVVLIPRISSFSGDGSGNLLLLATVAMFGVFALSSVRFLSRFTGFIKERLLNRVQNNRLVPSFRVVARTARFRCNSEAMGVIFISMVFVSAFFSTIAATTSSNHLRELVLFDNGAEIVVDVDDAAFDNNLELVDRVRSIDGVAEAAGILEYALDIVYQIAGPYATETYTKRFSIIGVESPAWGVASFSLPYFTQSAPLKDDLQVMAENTSLVLSSFRPITGFSVRPDYSYETVYGNEITLLSYIEGVNRSLEIIDLLSVDGALDSETYLPGHPDLINFLVVNIDLLHEMLGGDKISKIVVKTDEWSNHQTILSNINSVLGQSVLSIKSAQNRLEEILSTKSSQSIFGIYTLNLLFSILYLTLGMIIVTYDKIRGMSKQLSILRAMGTDVQSLIRAIMSDAMVSIGISCIIGSVVAVSMIMMVIHTPSIYVGSALLSEWFVLPISVTIAFEKIFAFVFIGFLFPIISALIIIRIQMRTGIADDLRNTE